jgi:hypothetical protein
MLTRQKMDSVETVAEDLALTIVAAEAATVVDVMTITVEVDIVVALAMETATRTAETVVTVAEIVVETAAETGTMIAVIVIVPTTAENMVALTAAKSAMAHLATALAKNATLPARRGMAVAAKNAVAVVAATGAKSVPTMPHLLVMQLERASETVVVVTTIVVMIAILTRRLLLTLLEPPIA